MVQFPVMAFLLCKWDGCVAVKMLHMSRLNELLAVQV